MKTIIEQYEFRYTNSDGKEVIYKCSKEILTWHELLREFHLFLKGQGFIFSEDKVFDLVDGEYEY